MIDIHNHLLYGIDDGARTLEESVEVIKDMKKMGYDAIILTPHYIKQSNYASTRENNLKKMSILQKALQDCKIDVDLYLGNELFIDEDIYDNLKNGIISSLNDSNYILVELPMSGEYQDYQDIFKDLINMGIMVVLAHPERYIAFQKDFSKIEELEKMGVIFQGNIESIIGGYGIAAKKTMKKLLKSKKLSFLATDIHHKKHDYSNWIKAKNETLKYISQSEWNILTYKNPSNLLD